mmetsp:Transcript_52878/g.141292  ORF Transcript_52878/g.141292 Transcript_52878/m.141292 type:complete len:120 (+) Transcript_52878:401-760(+)
MIQPTTQELLAAKPHSLISLAGSLVVRPAHGNISTIKANGLEVAVAEGAHGGATPRRGPEGRLQASPTGANIHPRPTIVVPMCRELASRVPLKTAMLGDMRSASRLSPGLIRWALDSST